MASVSKQQRQTVARWAEVAALFFRSRLANIAGHTFGHERNLYKAFGYKRELFAPDYRSRYRRNAVANRVVSALPMEMWRGLEVIEDEDPKVVTDFEEQWRELEERLNCTQLFLQADILSRIGRYAIIMIGAPGEFDTPLPKKLKPSDIEYLTAFPEEDATVQQFDVDVTSARFGLPIYYMVKRTTMVSPDSINSATVGRRVHWTRCIHIAEKLLDDRIFGEPALECVWNLFDDLEKVTGGGAEAFFKRADQGRLLNLDPTLDIDTDSQEELEKQLKEYDHGFRRTLLTRGLDVKPMGSDVADFANPVNSIISQISAGTGIPQRVLMGSEQGKLAAKMDRSNWDDRVSDRRLLYGGPKVVRPFVQRMIDHGVLSEPAQFDVRWADLKVMDDEQKAQVATQWAGLNTAAGATVVLPDEIRERVLGLPPLSEVNQDAADMNDAAFTDTGGPENDGSTDAGNQDLAPPNEPEAGDTTSKEPKPPTPSSNKQLRAAATFFDERKLRLMSPDRRRAFLRSLIGNGNNQYKHGGALAAHHVVQHLDGGGQITHGVFKRKSEADAHAAKLKKIGTPVHVELRYLIGNGNNQYKHDAASKRLKSPAGVHELGVVNSSGNVETKTTSEDELGSVQHSDVGLPMVAPEQRFRFTAGEVQWNETPEPDNYWKVDDHYGSKYRNVTHSVFNGEDFTPIKPSSMRQMVGNGNNQYKHDAAAHQKNADAAVKKANAAKAKGDMASAAEHLQTAIDEQNAATAAYKKAAKADAGPPSTFNVTDGNFKSVGEFGSKKEAIAHADKQASATNQNHHVYGRNGKLAYVAHPQPKLFRAAADARTAADAVESKVKSAVSAAFGKGKQALGGLVARLEAHDHQGVLTAANTAIMATQEELLTGPFGKLLAEAFKGGGLLSSAAVKKLRTAAGPNPKLGGLVFDATNPRAVDYIRSHTADTVQGISKTSRDDIKELVEEAFNGDYDVHELADEIEKIVDDPARAETIARTESMKASIAGLQEGWSQAEDAGLLTGDEEQVWIVTPDDRLCPICAPLDGETAPLDGTFEVDGDEIDGPPAHPNCRCTLGLQVAS